MIIIDRNETKGKKQKTKNRLTKERKPKKKQSEINWIKLKKTKIYLKQILKQCDTK